MIVRGLYNTAQQQKLMALVKLSLYPGFIYVHQILLFHSSAQKTISDPNRICYDSQ
jgi:hypothetical protein